MALRESVQYVWNKFHLEKQLNVLINHGLISKSEDTPRKSRLYNRARTTGLPDDILQAV